VVNVELHVLPQLSPTGIFGELCGSPALNCWNAGWDVT
jgi:hypothetical protein